MNRTGRAGIDHTPQSRLAAALILGTATLPVAATTLPSDGINSVIEGVLQGVADTVYGQETIRVIEDICPAAANGLTPVQAPLQRDCDGLVLTTIVGSPDEVAQIVAGFSQVASEETHTQGTQSVDARRSGSDTSNTVSARQSGNRFGGGRGAALVVQANGTDLMVPGAVRPGSGLAAGDGSGPWGVFVNGNFSFDDRDTTANEVGFESDTYGLTVGADYRFPSDAVLGAAVGYTVSDSDIDSRGGTLESDSYTLIGYASYYPSERSYVDFSAGYTAGDYDQDRRIFYFDPFNAAQIDQVASSSTDSDEWFVSATVGYDFTADRNIISVYGRFDYADISIDSFAETLSNPGATVNGSGLALFIDEQEFESATTTLGTTITRAMGDWFPYVMGEFVHEYENDNDPVRGHFVQDPNQRKFALPTDEPDRNFFNVGAGISGILGNGMAVYARYQALLGYEDLSLHAFEAGVRMQF